MIPLRDNIPSRRYPIVTVLLISLNFLVFLYESSLSREQLIRLFYVAGVVPIRLFHPDVVPGLPFPLTLLTSIFLHGGWLHLLGNMLFLWIFGDNVEDRLGHLKFLLFYLAGGVIANIVQFIITPFSKIPVVGASGAISAVMGAYFVLFPFARIASVVFFFLFFTIMEIPAFVYLFFWFSWQVLEGLLLLPFAGDVGGVAFWAHIGGFIYGYLVARYLLPRRWYFYR
ncbi:rhomboid family intramembrane serine protease [bacterium]|nr:rhomboid family intramembrane serine protease [bacterium]